MHEWCLSIGGLPVRRANRGAKVEKTISKDGTPIAFDRLGHGPAVILVDGGLCSRAFGPMPALARRLAPHFTVFHYDRRGRGDSLPRRSGSAEAGGDQPVYDVQREIEDLDAVIRAAGGSAAVFGASSGGALALEAAARLNGITRLAIYEAPFIVDHTHPPLSPTFIAETRALIESGHRGRALEKFMRLVGVPAPMVWLMPLLPFWKKLKAVAHTLTNDLTILEPYQQGRALTTAHFANVKVPVLVMAGGKSPAYMQNGMKQLAIVLPNATHVTLAGQTHMVKDAVVAPELVRFLALAPAALPAKELALSR
jgi:pimeloyl-ACP methyl ester carboxylesterase